MNLHVLGCSGAIAAGCRTTSFLLDDDVLIDAGTGVGDLALDALARIDHILVSPALRKRVRACVVDRLPRKNERPSDHAPVIVELD